MFLIYLIDSCSLNSSIWFAHGTRKASHSTWLRFNLGKIPKAFLLYTIWQYFLPKTVPLVICPLFSTETHPSLILVYRCFIFLKHFYIPCSLFSYLVPLFLLVHLWPQSSFYQIWSLMFLYAKLFILTSVMNIDCLFYC